MRMQFGNNITLCDSINR